MTTDTVKRCGTQTDMAVDAVVLDVQVSISDNNMLHIELDAAEEIHTDELIAMLMETIRCLEES